MMGQIQSLRNHKMPKCFQLLGLFANWLSILTKFNRINEFQIFLILEVKFADISLSNF